jgi:hypothetical protein
VGPPLIWGGAAFWLYQQGDSGWAIFMVLWGALAVSSVDNFLKPFLISRTASLPILLIALGPSAACWPSASSALPRPHLPGPGPGPVPRTQPAIDAALPTTADAMEAA